MKQRTNGYIGTLVGLLLLLGAGGAAPVAAELLPPEAFAGLMTKVSSPGDERVTRMQEQEALFAELDSAERVRFIGEALPHFGCFLFNPTAQFYEGGLAVVDLTSFYVEHFYLGPVFYTMQWAVEGDTLVIEADSENEYAVYIAERLMSTETLGRYAHLEVRHVEVKVEGRGFVYIHLYPTTDPDTAPDSDMRQYESWSLRPHVRNCGGAANTRYRTIHSSPRAPLFDALVNMTGMTPREVVENQVELIKERIKGNDYPPNFHVDPIQPQ